MREMWRRSLKPVMAIPYLYPRASTRREDGTDDPRLMFPHAKSLTA